VVSESQRRRSATNIPLQSTPFIGRKGDLARIRAIAATSRLVTLIGEPGIGKTRLAIELGLSGLAQYEDGVWFVPLDSLNDSSQLHYAIAKALSIREEPGRPLEHVIVQRLRDKQLLLILDHCDRARETVGQLIHKLASHCPRIRVLATCREGLDVESERLYRVPALSIPLIPNDADSLTPTYALFRFESSRLFMDRARRCRPEFELPSRSIFPLCQLCLQLDGNALAIELAAAQAHSLAIDQLLAYLARRAEMHREGGSAGGPTMHPLEFVIEWSYGLLSVKERLLLLRLSVFAGGWEMEVAEQICSDPPEGTLEGSETRIASGEVSATIHNMVQRSLIAKTETARSTRYAMPQPVLSFVTNKRSQSREDNWIRARHRSYFSRLAHDSAIVRGLAGQRFAPEGSNGGADGRGDEFNEAWKDATLCALTAPDRAEALMIRRQSSHDGASAEALDLMGSLAADRKDLVSARMHLSEALDLWRRIGDEQRIAAALESMAALECLEK
jgi:non-specific serine/threonine protein kinase